MEGIEKLLRRRRELLEEIDRRISESYQRPVTLLFTDIVGSTEFFESAGDIAGRQMIQTHNDLLFPIIQSHEGRIIKTIGDSIMASFESPVQAVRCAVRLQEALKAHNGGRPEPERIGVRMGLHYGKAVMEDRDLFGDMVNTSARVESRAEGGEILISGALKEQIEAENPPLVFLGSDTVKGRKQKIDFFLVNWDGRPQEEVRSSWERRSAGGRKPAAASAAEAEPAPAGPTPARTAPGQIRQRVLFKGRLGLETAAAQIKPLSGKGNPYLNRVMIPHPGLFFGREAAVRRIMSRISAQRPQSVSVVGERRIGKSSLLNFLRAPQTRLRFLADPETSLFLLVDFQQLRTVDEAHFLGLLYAELRRQYGESLELELEHTYEGLRVLCDQLTEQGCRLAFLFDEFESVTKNPNIRPPFYSLLRSLANSFSVAFVTASGRQLKDMCVSHEIADSPFFNIFAAQHLGLFRTEEALALIREPSLACGLPLEPVSQSVLTMGGLYPFFLQIACSAWYEHLDSERLQAQAFAGRETPLPVLQAFREEAEPHFEYVLQTLPPEELDALERITRSEAPDPAAVESLTRKGYLQEAPAGGYEPFSAEFRRFVERFRH